ncbi:ribonuclease regulator [Vibrio sp. T187]|uniref:ribonuclease regulator n=1 Tax=Vibrio TaxID=662 RepID=UPI0010C95B66|nr:MULTISPECIES: ribonuclease regulator [Vibrio]MBW3697098.1 ribonuclease regulator [Vibrio sp. T187]
MRKLLFLLSLVVPAISHATSLPELPSQSNEPVHKFFLSSQSPSSENFDIWKIDGGYSYNVFKSIDLYVGARVNNSTLGNENGFLSGVSYQISDKISLNSTFHTYVNEVNDEKESGVGAEVSSRMKLSENLDIHATLDYEEWQQGIEVGLGFRF